MTESERHAEYLLLDAELVVVGELFKACIENVYIQAAFLPPEETPC